MVDGLKSDDARAAIARFLFVSDPAQAVDLAFVFGSPSISSVLPAIELYRAGLTRRILISGKGPVADQPEWRLYRDRAVADGVDPADILVECEALNTLENAVLGAQVVADGPGWEDIRTVAICAKPVHMRRAMMTARKVFPDHVRLVAQPPVGTSDLAAETWWQSARGRRVTLEELGRISAYALKGDIGDF